MLEIEGLDISTSTLTLRNFLHAPIESPIKSTSKTESTLDPILLRFSSFSRALVVHESEPRKRKLRSLLPAKFGLDTTSL